MLSEHALRALRRLASDHALRHINLSHNPLTDEGLELLARSPWLGRVHTLELKGCDLSARGIEALTRSPHLGNLRVLRLRHNDLRDESALLLAQCAALANLEVLDIHHCGLTEAGWSAISSSTTLNPGARQPPRH